MSLKPLENTRPITSTKLVGCDTHNGFKNGFQLFWAFVLNRKMVDAILKSHVLDNERAYAWGLWVSEIFNSLVWNSKMNFEKNPIWYFSVPYFISLCYDTNLIYFRRLAFSYHFSNVCTFNRTNFRANARSQKCISGGF